MEVTTSTSRSFVASNCTYAPSRPSPSAASEPAVTSSPLHVPCAAIGRSNTVRVWMVCGSVSWQKPRVVMVVSTVRSSTTRTLEPVTRLSAWPVLSMTVAFSVAGKVYRCTPVRSDAVSSACTTPSGACSPTR